MSNSETSGICGVYTPLVSCAVSGAAFSCSALLGWGGDVDASRDCWVLIATANQLYLNLGLLSRGIVFGAQWPDE